MCQVEVELGEGFLLNVGGDINMEDSFIIMVEMVEV